MTDNTLFTANTLPPLAARMRPNTLTNYAGQSHLVGEDKFVAKLLRSGEMFSLILWGPPGTGKTTLARLIASSGKAVFYELSAVSASVKDVREIIRKSESNKHMGRATLLFIDEIHRFSKNQQDALLHAVENGDVILIGATTENPSFEVISPLLSRCRILRLQPLKNQDLAVLLDKALSDDIVLSKYKITLKDKVKDFLVNSAGGDARKLYNTFELSIKLARKDSKTLNFELTKEDIEIALQEKALLYDKDADYHYDTISAFIKSVRGSDPDAAVYWMTVMLEGGEDALFIARRLLILASEDIGNADPQALVIANAGFQAVKAIGLPEGAIVLAQVTTFMASSPKSNASYSALRSAQKSIRDTGFQNIPLHLRNAPTDMMKQFQYGLGYDYPHNYDESFISQNYMPENKPEDTLYKPRQNGYEKYISKRLASLWPDRYGDL